MTKRIVSGIFILTALGALGVILAGALTSGEQLIVRFLTAVIVAALGLYVISDLRLQADDDALPGRTSGHGRLATVDAPPNSTAAFMATVTKKGEARNEESADAATIPPPLVDVPADQPMVGVGASPTAASELASAIVDGRPPSGEGDDSGIDETAPFGGAGEAVASAPAAASSTEAQVTDLFGRKTGTADDLGFGTADGPPRLDVDALPRFGDPDRITDDRSRSTVDAEDLTDDPFYDDGREGFRAETATFAEFKSGDGSRPDQLIDSYPLASGFEYSDDLQSPLQEWPAPSIEVAPKESDAATNPSEQATEVASIEEVARVSGDREEGATIGDPAVELVGPMTDLQDTTEFQDTTEIEIDSISDRSVLEGDSPIRGLAGAASGHLGLSGSHRNGVHRSGGRRDLSTPPPAQELLAADYADAPLAPIIDLRNVTTSQGNIDAAINVGELEVIATLIEQGMLSTEGPISDRDVRTMVYVAFTSNELRKLLLAGGTPDGPNHGLDLGPVELFDERIHAPAPKMLYAGLVDSEPKSQLG